VALVSPAARTTATADVVLAGLTDPPEYRLEKALYGADPDEVIDQLRALEDDVRAAMVVGHNPTAFDLSQGLIESSDKKGLAVATRRGFPTCALGIYRFRVERWREVNPRGARLVDLMTPPYGGK
jgi:phosphohistidine phosphatase